MTGWVTVSSQIRACQEATIQWWQWSEKAQLTAGFREQVRLLLIFNAPSMNCQWSDSLIVLRIITSRLLLNGITCSSPATSKRDVQLIYMLMSWFFSPLFIGEGFALTCLRLNITTLFDICSCNAIGFQVYKNTLITSMNIHILFFHEKMLDLWPLTFQPASMHSLWNVNGHNKNKNKSPQGCFDVFYRLKM